MKRQMFFATVFSAALAVSGAAQTGAPGAQTGSQQTQQKEQQVTMVGCLQQSSAGAAGTTGTAGAKAEAHFILSNASPASGSAAGSTTAGTSGTAGASSAAGNRYRLVGGDREDLEKYLNSKVEIRGTVERGPSSSMPGSGTGAGAPPTGAPAGQSSDEKLPTLRVTSVRQIAKDCAGGN
jgi:hypothetical protein